MSNPLGWHYPAGAEHDPNAPYNQKPTLDLSEVIEVKGSACELFDTLQELKNDDPSWFNLYQPLGKVLRNCQDIIDALQKVESELIGD